VQRPAPAENRPGAQPAKPAPKKEEQRDKKKEEEEKK
jgi:hypothetical protein